MLTTRGARARRKALSFTAPPAPARFEVNTPGLAAVRRELRLAKSAKSRKAARAHSDEARRLLSLVAMEGRTS